MKIYRDDAMKNQYFNDRRKTGLTLTVMICLLSFSRFVMAKDKELKSFSVIEQGVSNVGDANKTMVNELLVAAQALVNDKPDSALVLLQKALYLSGDSTLLYQQTKAFGLVAISYLRKGQTKESQSFLDMAFKNAAILHDRNLLVYLHNINAMNYQQTGAYGNSISHYLKAIDLIKDSVDQFREIQTYVNFGGLWTVLGEPKQALKYFTLAKDITPRSNHNYPYILMNIGIASVDSSKDFAIQKFQEALQAVSGFHDLYLTQKLYLNLSLVYEMKQDFDSALFYLRHAEVVTKNLGTGVTLAGYQANAGNLYYEMKDYAKAETYLQSSLLLSQRYGLRDGVMNLHKSLAKVYEAQGNFEKAFMHQSYAIAFHDSMQQYEKDKTIDLMLDYQRAEKDRLIAQKQLQLTKKESELKQRNIWIVGILAAGFCFIALFSYVFRNSKHKQKLQLGELALLKQQREIDKLKALATGEENERNRIAHELHDSVMIGFAAVKMQLNALPNQFPAISETQAHYQILKQLDKATAELRRTAHNLMPDVLLDEGLIQAIFYFCKNIKETSGLLISFQHVGPELPRFKMDFEISIYRIVQELLQNVIKHADATKALVQLSYGEDYFSLTVEDNGKGFDPSKIIEGMGLKSIRNKLQAFGCSFDIRSRIDYSTTIYTECPVRSLLLVKC